MENKEFSLQLEHRTKLFAINILKLSAQVPNTYEGRVIRNQISKSGTVLITERQTAQKAMSILDIK